MNLDHARQELSHLQNWMSQMSVSYVALSKQPQAENAESHFIAIKQHQIKAEVMVNDLIRELNKSDRNSDLMLKMIKKVTVELELAAKEHDAELNEIEYR